MVSPASMRVRGDRAGFPSGSEPLCGVCRSLRGGSHFGRSSSGAHRASQPLGAHDQLRRLHHSDVESETGVGLRLPSLAEIGTADCGPTSPKSGAFTNTSGLSQVGLHCQRTARPRDRHAHALHRSNRRCQNRLLLAPLRKHQRRNRPLVRRGTGHDYWLSRQFLKWVPGFPVFRPETKVTVVRGHR